jgi:hypothetical protein
MRKNIGCFDFENPFFTLRILDTLVHLGRCYKTHESGVYTFFKTLAKLASKPA